MSLSLPRLRLVGKPRDECAVPAGNPAAQGGPVDDALIVAGLRAQDDTTADRFYERVRPLIDRTLGRLLGRDDSDFEDVAQIALHEVIVTIHKFRGDCPLDAWLSIIIARAAYRHIRRRRFERRLFAPLPDELTIRSRPASFAARDGLDRVVAHLMRMTPERAWAYLLHDVHGYDLAEISQILGVSVRAAQSRLVRGRREVHERIRNDPELVRFLEDFSEENS